MAKIHDKRKTKQEQGADTRHDNNDENVISIQLSLLMCWHKSHKANFRDNTGTKNKQKPTINEKA
jgi:hypothetical protein